MCFCEGCGRWWRRTVREERDGRSAVVTFSVDHIQRGEYAEPEPEWSYGRALPTDDEAWAEYCERCGTVGAAPADRALWERRRRRMAQHGERTWIIDYRTVDGGDSRHPSPRLCACI
jgi:hypothetical protein